jgi:hypothetical protein
LSPSLGSPHQNTVCSSHFSHACHTLSPSSSLFIHPNNIWWIQIIKVLAM